MDLGTHAGFIVAAYAVAAGLLLLLVGWVTLDYRAQQRTLARLEQQGITRRSARSGAARSEPAA